MENYKNPDYEGNSSKYHTGKECIEPDCHNPAGTWWSSLWCFECNAKRMDGISKSFEEIEKRMEGA
jgi:hypothetical protein